MTAALRALVLIPGDPKKDEDGPVIGQLVLKLPSGVNFAWEGHDDHNGFITSMGTGSVVVIQFTGPDYTSLESIPEVIRNANAHLIKAFRATGQRFTSSEYDTAYAYAWAIRELAKEYPNLPGLPQDMECLCDMTLRTLRKKFYELKSMAHG